MTIIMTAMIADDLRIVPPKKSEHRHCFKKNNEAYSAIRSWTRNTSMTDTTPKNMSAASKNHTDHPCVR